MNKELLIVDIETTDLNPCQGHIVELGAVLIDLENEEIRKLLDTCITPDTVVEDWKKAWVFNNSDLTVEDVLNGVHLDEIRSALQNTLNDHAVTAFNNEFDFGYLELNEFEIPHKRPCLMKLLTPILKIPGPYGYKWPKFQEAWNFYFPYSDYKERHRAYDDARHEAQLLLSLLKIGVFQMENFKY